MLDECTLHPGAPGNGYGVVRFGGRQIGAHVRAWVVAHGPVPPGMVVCHRCDVPLCVNVDHLWLGTQGDNVRDAAAKGRLLTGAAWRAVERHLPTGRAHPRPRARLTEADVRAIRSEAATSTQRALAQRYGVGPSVISRIVNRKAWGWVA